MAMATTKNDPAPMSGVEIPPAAVERIEALERENAELRAEIERLRVGATDSVKTFAPRRPSFGLSAGEAADLELHGVANSPFTGERLNALTEGVEPSSKEAARAAERERDKDGN